MVVPQVEVIQEFKRSSTKIDLSLTNGSPAINGDGHERERGQSESRRSERGSAMAHHGHHNQQQMRPSISPSTGGAGSTLLLENGGAPSPHSSPLMNGDYASYANYNSTQWEI